MDDILKHSTSLVDLLRRRAAAHPERRVYTFLSDGVDGAQDQLSYGELDRAARTIAARLTDQLAVGERALLLYPAGLDFITAFFGCLYAGVVAVPAYPPTSKRHLPRLSSILADAHPKAVLTTRDLERRVTRLAAAAPELAALPFLTTDGTVEEGGAQLAEPRADQLAFLQYTSGSTALPKGVMVTHGNLLHNQGLIRRAFGHSATSTVVGWLPLYHDMGLIGNVLQPLYLGSSCVLMSPLSFLRRPRSWLEAISRFRATTSGGPSFAYELCVQKIPAAERQGLDLSTWQVAFNGAEPIRAATLDAFAAAFAPHGFSPSAFYPCYGLAEATLFVTGGAPEDEPVIVEVATRELEAGSASLGSTPSAAPSVEGERRRLVGCGRSAEQRLVIVDPESFEPCADGRVGEIWVSGASVAAGYWRRDEASAATFGARLADGDGPYLRTGDLGILQGGELFVTGRAKDLLIYRGRNVYPQDLEWSVERCHPALRPGGGAAFAVEVAGEERPVVVQELHRGRDGDASAALVAARRALAEEHELAAHEVVLVRAGSVPKTSSGKVQRRASRELYLRGGFPVIARSAAVETVAETAPALDRDSLLNLPADERRAALEDDLRCRVEALLGVSGLRRRQPFSAHGLDSLRAAELEEAVVDAFGVDVDVAELLDGLDLAGLAKRVMAGLEADGDPESAAIEAVVGLEPSLEQERLWWLEQLLSSSAPYHIPVAWRLAGALDVAALAATVTAIDERHPVLRTVFTASGKGPRPRLEAASPRLPEVDLSALSKTAREGEATRLLAEQVAWPFETTAGRPLSRLLLLRLAADVHELLFVAHHLIFDLRSLELWARELEALYTAARSGQRPALPRLGISFNDLAAWQRRALQTPRSEEAARAWQRRLNGASALDLPVDRKRGEAPDEAPDMGCHSLPMTVPEELCRRLEALGQEHGATLFMSLFASLAALLARWCEQDDLVVASPIDGRFRPEARDLLGFFAYPLLLRVDAAGDPTGEEVLARARRTALDAYADRSLPFVKVVEAVGEAGHTAPRLLFSLLDEGAVDGGLELPELQSERLTLPRSAIDLELSITLARARGRGLRGVLEGRAGLFERATLERFLAAWLGIITELVDEPSKQLSRLDVDGELLARAERARERLRPRTLAVAATFTAEPLATSLAFWQDELGRDAEVVFAPYNQVQQSLLSPSSVLRRNRRGANLVLLRFEDVWRFHTVEGTAPPAAERRRLVDEAVAELLDALEQAATSAVPYVVVICPPSPRVMAEDGVWLAEKAAELCSRLASLAGVSVLSPPDLALYRVAASTDPHADELGHVPYTQEGFAALGTAVARRLEALLRPSIKVIALDCDQTLWAGVCGEDGAAGVRLDEPYRELQTFMVEQQQAGRLISLSSKNHEDDVFEVFERPDMVLRREHLVGWRLGWQAKSSSLKQLAEELDLGLDSFVFLDDNPLEVAEVAANVPQVTALRLPEEAAEIPRFLRHLWIFDHGDATAEDRQRTQLYRQQAERERSRREAPSLARFLAELRLEIRVSEAHPDDADRVAQLTERTSQLNTCPERRTPTEIRELIDAEAGALEPRVVRVKDRFGDYGLVGVMLFRVVGERLRVEGFLLSCRALGRGVEQRMLAALGELAVARRLAVVEVLFRPTVRNQPAGDLLRRAAKPTSRDADLWTFTLAAEKAASLVFQPDETASATSAPVPQPVRRDRLTAAQLERIVHELAEPSQVLAAIRERQARQATPEEGDYVEPSTPIERELAAMWGELLGRERISATAPFFALGGSSLLGVQLISRVREAFQVDLPLRQLLSERLTVARTAELIEEAMIDRADDGEIDDILAGLEGLSEDEIQALLESEGGA